MPALGSISSTDRALLASLAAWASAEGPALLLRLGHQRARSLSEASKGSRLGDPIAALRLAHEAQISPNPAHVDLSWYVRALQEEAPSVQRVVVGSIDEPLRTILINSLHLSASDLRPDHPADPAAQRVALALWTERLIGDMPTGPDDPPAVVAIAGLARRQLYRLHRLIGLEKLATLPDSAHERPRRLPDPHPQTGDPRLIKLASNDWAAARDFGRHAIAALAFVTFGRLLGQVDPHRLRWTLQHLPYPIAKRVRAAASHPSASVPAVIEWEARFLDAALLRLDRRCHS